MTRRFNSADQNDRRSRFRQFAPPTPLSAWGRPSPPMHAAALGPLPHMDERYIVMQAVNMWTDDFGTAGTRTNGGKAANCFIAGPKWNDATPKDVDQVFRCSTRYAWILVQRQLEDVNICRSNSEFHSMPFSRKLASTQVAHEHELWFHPLAWSQLQWFRSPIEHARAYWSDLVPCLPSLFRRRSPCLNP